MKIKLFAPDGRMGRAIAAATENLTDVALVEDGADVLIDFSAPDALERSVEDARGAGCALLVGTTGLGDEHDAMLTEASKAIAVLKAPNTSIGVALLADLVERAARVLRPEDWDVEISETHHRHKADAPSGTALHLGGAAARGRGGNTIDERGRDGTGLERTQGAIGYAALRGGSVAGDHDVLFLGPQERLILSHRAEDRAIFARGAIAAARFLQGRSPGLYSMADVIDAA
ncbi:4-hydroxy-tetrahydrodipicolinate reductase [Sphingomicrobium sp. XHP0235]|uniref:4-hydroxy-tetrahydrodipicolinate reductase n=1 Tax=Sphingomicrobium aquimarinum TaxID=3133971 RepID=UPI0031FEB342